MLSSLRILVLGLGDMSWGDAGIGVRLLRSLRGAIHGADLEEAPPDLNFLDISREYDFVILVGAIWFFHEVGRVLVVSPYSIRDLRGSWDICLEKLEMALSEARTFGRRVPRIEIVGVSVRNEVQSGPTLTAEMTAAYGEILSQVRKVVSGLLQEARESGFKSSRRTS